jgi:hypothetical protein
MAQIGFKYCRKACRFAMQGQFEVKYAPILSKILADIPKIEVIMPQIAAENFCQKCIVCRLILMPYLNAVD